MRIISRVRLLHRLLPSTLTAFVLACANDPGPGATDETSPDTGTSESTSESTSDSETDTTGSNPSCELDMLPGEWLFSIVDGDFPNDVPEDLEDECMVVAGLPDQIHLDCVTIELTLDLPLDPKPTLPEPGSMATLRFHHEPGWLNWPDVWIDLELADGDRFTFQVSSVLVPEQGPFVVPHSPTLTRSTCGPYVAVDDFGNEDACGEQVGLELRYLVAGQQVDAWHGTYTTQLIDDRAFEVWLTGAREYLAQPEFCDIAPTLFIATTRHEGPPLP